MGIFDATLQKYGDKNKSSDGVFSNTLNRYSQQELNNRINDSYGFPLLGKSSLSTSPVPNGAMDTEDMIKEIIQATTRTVGTVGITAGNLPFRAVGKKGPFQDEIQTTGSPITEAIFGKTPIKSFKKYGEAGIDFVDEATGLAIDKRFAPFYAAAGIVMDLTGTGGGAKNIFKSLHGAKSYKDAAIVMRSAGFDDDIIKQYAPIFAGTTARKETSVALEAALKLQNTTRKSVTTPLRTVDNSRPVTIGGKAFDESVGGVREDVGKLFNNVPKEKRSPEIVKARSVIKENEAPTITQLNTAVKVLEDAGEDVSKIRSVVDDLTLTVKAEPERFVSGVSKAAGEIESLTVPSRFNRDTTETFTVGDNVAYETGEGNSSQLASGTILEINEKGEFLVANRGTRKDFVGPITESLQHDPEIVVLRPDDIFGKPIPYSPARESARIASEDAQKSADSQFVKEQIEYEKKVNELLKDDQELQPWDSPTWEKDIKEQAAAFKTTKLDEVADPVRENLGILSAQVQERYGKGVITKNSAEKFAKEEVQIINEISKYAEEAENVVLNGGEMVQKMPAWVPNSARDISVFNEVTEILKKGDVPTVHGGPHMELYTAMIDEIARRSGVVNNGPKRSVDPTGAVLQLMRENNVPQGQPLIRTDIPEQGVTLDQANAEYLENKKPKTIPVLLKDVDFTEIKKAGFFSDVNDNIMNLSEKVFGNQWEKIRKVFLEPFMNAKAGMAADEAMFLKELDTEVVKKFNIKKGSKESALLQNFGERKITYDQLVKAAGKEKADNIVESAKWFRAKYDQMIVEINLVLPEEQKIFSRDDYFRHWGEMTDALSLKNAAESVDFKNVAGSSWSAFKKYTGLDFVFSKLSGKVHLFRKQSFEKERLGDKSKKDAIGGFLDYVPQYVYSKHINTTLPHIDQFIKEVGEQVGEEGKKYVEALNRFRKDLAGDANPIDVATSKVITKEGLDALTYWNNRVKSNAILGNLGSTPVQILNLPNVLGSVKHHVFNGMKRTLADAGGWGKGIQEMSPGYMERYRGDKYNTFNVGMLENSKAMAGWLLSAFDRGVYRLSFNSHLEKAIKEGISNPKGYADYMTLKMIGGRGVGEMPLLQKSKTFQLIAPFQYEMGNTIRRYGDALSEKDIAKLAIMMTTTWLAVQAGQRILGRKVMMDPGQAIYDSIQIGRDDVDDEGNEMTVGDKVKGISGRLTGEVLSGIPLGSYVASAFAGTSGMTEKEREAFFSEQGDPLRYGSTPLLYNAVAPMIRAGWSLTDSESSPEKRKNDFMDSVYMLGPNWGGKQIKNTIQGIGALARGEVVDNAGEVIMDTKPGVVGAIQNVLLGKWSPNFQYQEELEKEIKVLYEENKGLLSTGNPEDKKIALQNIEELPLEMRKIYKTVKDQKKVEQFGKDKMNMEPTYRIVTGLVREGKKEEAVAILTAMSEEERKIYGGLKKDIKSKDYALGEYYKEHPEGMIRTVIDYGYAFGTNPKRAWQIMFGDHDVIETTYGDGLIVPRRMSKGESEAYKKEHGAKKGQILEHKLPLSMGGSNKEENLEIVNGAIHDIWTTVEVYLGDAIKRGKIPHVDAQELIMRFKGYEGEAISFDEIKKIVGVEKFDKSDEGKKEVIRGWDDIGRNTWLLSDQDYAEREDPLTGNPQGPATIKDLIRDLIGKKKEDNTGTEED